MSTPSHSSACHRQRNRHPRSCSCLRSGSISLWAASVLLIASTRASAQGATRTPDQASATHAASAAFWEGKEHYDHGRVREALEQFLRAYELTEDADLLYNLAQTYRRLGQCQASLEHYRRYVATAPVSPTTSYAQTQIETLKSQCPEPQEPAEQPQTKAAEPSPTVSSQPHAHESIARESSKLASTPRPTPRAFETKQGSSTQQHLRAASVATLVTGLGLAGVGVALKVWNDHRYGIWQDRDRDLQAFRESKIVDSTVQGRMQANNDLGNSILSMQKYEISFAVASGVFCVSAVALYLLGSSSTSPHSPRASRPGPLALHSVVLSHNMGGLTLEGTL